jgi:hypothetical protein
MTHELRKPVVARGAMETRSRTRYSAILAKNRREARITDRRHGCVSECADNNVETTHKEETLPWVGPFVKGIRNPTQPYLTPPKLPMCGLDNNTKIGSTACLYITVASAGAASQCFASFNENIRSIRRVWSERTLA